MANISADVIRYAQQTEAKYGVPASVTIAQYGVESGWGSSNLAKNANNYFGITGKNKATGQYVMQSGRSWAKYGSMEESFNDHGRLLSTDLYASKHKNTKNAFAYVDAIAETYAPSSDGNNGYAALVKQVIKDNNLTQYDGAGVSVDNSQSSGYYIPDSSTGGTYVPSGGAVVGDTEFLGVDWGVIVGKVIKFVVLAVLGVLAATFFFNAFNMKNPVKIKVKKPKKDGVANGG